MVNQQGIIWALNSMVVGVVQMDQHGLVTFTNLKAQEMLNLTARQLEGHYFLDCHSKSIRELIGIFFLDALTGTEMETVIKLRGRYVEYHFSPVRDETDTVTGVVAVLTDVSEKINVENYLTQALAEQEIFQEAARIINSTLELSQVLNRLLEIIRQVIDYSCCRIYLFREEARELVLEAKYAKRGYKFENDTPETLASLIFEEPILVNSQDNHTIYYIQLKRGTEELGLIYLDIGDREILPAFIARIMGNLSALACLSIKNAQMYRKIHQLATRDGLTGLYNRQHFDRILIQEVERSKRSRKPLSLIMVDVNGLKEINDQVGHTAGDFILREAARLLLDTVRGTDYVFRYGGDEMVMILVEASSEKARKVINRVRKNVALWNANYRQTSCENGEITLSLSMGFAVTEGGEAAEAILNRADRYMYRNKEHYYQQKYCRQC
ncbi:MAG TPA: sensor domain-containing diguanylate cyclase [Bacillota bacterium]|nr:sensor domain-containing diguanylate cyclase [Bacillota bacterium]